MGPNAGAFGYDWVISPMIFAATCFWIFLIGSAVGSFLNVVVWRLPAGMDLARPGSHCPRCGHAIRWCDNVPVLGWIWLGGRCRDCRGSISPRYPIVEAATGLAFLLLFLGPAVHTPPREVLVPDGKLLLPLTLEQQTGLAGFWAFLAATLLSAALIEWDRKLVPPRLFWPAILVGFAAPLFWPWLRPMSTIPPTDLEPPYPALIHGVLAIVEACIVGGGMPWIFGYWRHAAAILPASIAVAMILGPLPGGLAIGLATTSYSVSHQLLTPREPSATVLRFGPGAHLLAWTALAWGLWPWIAERLTGAP